MTLRISKPQYISSFLARVTPGTEQSVKESIASTFREFDPEFFEVYTYGEIMKGMYEEEARFGTIVVVFGLIALVVAMLGVFGLSLFLSNELRFDTSIMRVFGASGSNIIVKNTSRYLLYVIAGNIISIPLVIIIMKQWLQEFAFKVSITPWVFIVAFFLSATVFIITTYFNTSRLANINPVDNLRQE
jgi:putative ABC transport system permease protein